VEGTAVSLSHPALVVVVVVVVVVGWGAAVLLMRFFSRSAIYIWDRRPPSTPYLAIEPVELMQAVEEEEWGSQKRKQSLRLL